MVYRDSLSIEVDRFPDRKDRANTTFSEPQDLLTSFIGFVSSPQAAHIFTIIGGIGSLIAGLVATMQVYEILTDRKVAEEIKEISKAVGVGPIVS